MYTSAMALIFSSLFMSVTGGGLKPYEVRAVQAGFASLSGDQQTARMLMAEFEPIPRRTPAVHLIPIRTIAAQPGLDIDAALLGGDLLGEPGFEIRPPRLTQIVVSTPRRALRVTPVAHEFDQPVEASGEDAAPSPPVDAEAEPEAILVTAATAAPAAMESSVLR